MKLKDEGDNSENIAFHAKALHFELGCSGVDLTGVGVGLGSDGSTQAIHVLLLTKKFLARVPATYAGYEVVVKVTGQVKPL